MRCMKHIAVAMMMSTSVLAGSGPDLDMDAMERAKAEAEEALKQTFSNFAFQSFEVSPVDGVYQIDTGEQMIYYAPGANVLLFGEMWDADGNNLTEAALTAAAEQRMAGIDFSSALEFGPVGAPLITEYSNPECGYCQRLHAFLEKKAKGDSRLVRRRIIFAVGHSTTAQGLAEHILCSENPEEAFSEIYERRKPQTFLSCDEGQARLEEHMKIAKAAGIRGTPTLNIGGDYVRGFDQARLETFLETTSEQGDR